MYNYILIRLVNNAHITSYHGRDIARARLQHTRQDDQVSVSGQTHLEAVRPCKYQDAHDTQRSAAVFRRL